jgi:hypothetical protein
VFYHQNGQKRQEGEFENGKPKEGALYWTEDGKKSDTPVELKKVDPSVATPAAPKGEANAAETGKEKKSKKAEKKAGPKAKTAE